MKNIVKLSALALATIVLASCKLDFTPSDELSADILLKDEGGAEYIMDGCYATLKDEVEFLGYSSGNSYVRHYFQMQELPADNMTLAGVTTDDLYKAYSYNMTDNLKNDGTVWWLAYKVIYMSNTVIETLKEGLNADADQLLGEAYFLRALMHQHMLALFAKPYTVDKAAMGVVLRTSTNTAETKRASVEECYKQVVDDLKKAASLLKDNGRGNGGYPCKNTALGLLSRVYLYMGQDDDVISTVNSMLGGGDGSDKLESKETFPLYFTNAINSKETLFCVAHTALETKGQSSIGSMYLTDGMGWGEIYASQPLLDLYERYPEDIRYTSFIIPQIFDENKMFVCFVDPATPEPLVSGMAPLMFEVKKAANGIDYEFTDGGTKYTVKSVARTNPNYQNEWEVTYGGKTWPARVTKQMSNRFNYFKYFVTKFSYQDDDPMLSSPVMLRWGEVILNLAEAYAHKGDKGNAIKYVNVIRNRAGIPTFSEGNMLGYTDILKVVMDERRMELAFEGDRRMDVYTNKLNMDRQFPGCHPYKVIEYNDNKIQNPIPQSEYSVSGIEQNPGY